jgi:ABC-type multidrug transport system ATPase subunit
MEVILHKATKRFGREVIFKDVDRTFRSGSRTVILGPNGSGKSTLLQLVAGATAPTEGKVEHRIGDRTVPEDEVYRSISIASPYLGLYEDLSLQQAIGMHARFKPFRSGLKAIDIARIAYLDHALQKPVLNFSSGMKQRLKLALAILSDAPLLLLDEPSSNLDEQAVKWYNALLEEHIGDRTLVVASNRQPSEYHLCTQQIEMGALKG